MNEQPLVLIADDDPDIREVVRLLLTAEGCRVLEAADGYEAVERTDDSVDLILLDVMMPGQSGFLACQQIREKTLAPILFLTARTEDSDKTLGFSVGGDDYLVKPFSYSELVSRVKAMLRRYREYGSAASPAAQPLRFSDVTIDTEACEVLRGDVPIDLTDIEYRILILMASHRKKVFSVQNLYESVWNEPYFYTSSNTVMVHIKNLRRKLSLDGRYTDLIRTVWGKGYRID